VAACIAEVAERIGEPRELGRVRKRVRELADSLESV
jgi:hypothetical protein